MDDIVKQKKAKEMFLSISQTLDAENWSYKKNEEDLTITCRASGEDLPMDLTIVVNAEHQQIKIISPMPYKMEEKKRIDGAIAISVVNNRMVHGSFIYNILNGSIIFCMAQTFWGSLLSREALRYLIFCTCQTVDEYNDKFLMISKDLLSLEQFIQAEYK